MNMKIYFKKPIYINRNSETHYTKSLKSNYKVRLIDRFKMEGVFNLKRHTFY